MTAQLDVVARAVSDEEVEMFADRGWVHLPGLISPELAAALLERARGWMGADGDEHPWRRSRAHFQTFEKPSRQDPLYERLVLRTELGRNVARLLGRDTPVRLLDDTLQAKLPAAKGDPPTPFHQDGPFLPLDKPSANVWIALAEVTPEMGLMRFRTGSQKLGPLGRHFHDSEDAAIAAWPRLARFPSERPAALAPGDATVHTSLLVHSAPENSTARTRWSYLLNVYPADANYLYPHRSTDGLELELFKPLADERFPVMYEGPTR